MSDEQLKRFSEEGRGRLLHPESELKQLGHPWKKEEHATDTSLIPEFQKPLLEVKGLKVSLPCEGRILLSYS